MSNFPMNTRLAQHGRHISGFTEVKNKERAKSNLWFFDSPKNQARLLIKTDLAFSHLLLAEGDINIVNYSLVSDPNDGKPIRTGTSAIVQFVDERRELWQFRWSKDVNIKDPSMNHLGLPGKILTEQNFKGREVEFDNWLLLCAAITRIRHLPSNHEQRVLLERLDQHRAITFGSLLKEDGVDPAIMTGLVARALQKGILYTELRNDVFGLHSLLKREGI